MTWYIDYWTLLLFALFYKASSHNSRHKAGHVMGKLPKKTSQGNGNRKRSSYARSKKYQGQGK